MADISTQLANLGIKGIAANQEGFKALADVIREDETILAAVAGTFDGHYGAAAATDQRVVFVGRSTGFIRRVKTEEYVYPNITSIEVKTGLAQAKVELVVPGNRAVIDKVPNEQAKGFAAAVRRKIASAHAPQTPTPQVIPTPQVDIAGQIEKLADLKERGILTDEEFQTQKRKLLG